MNWFRQNKNKVLSLSFLVIIFSFLPQVADAQLAIVKEYYVSVAWTFVNTVFGWMLWAGGVLINYSVTTFVVGFGSFYVNSGIGEAVNTLWGKVRDIFNLTFIFGLVYIGFKMILDSSDSSAKKMLGSLLIAALLVNFSLFITKSVVDFSNIAAKQFAEPFLVVNNAGKEEYEISSKFMELLGLTSIISFEFFDAPEKAGFGYVFGTAYLYIIGAFVFGAGGILLLIRFIVLNIYMLLSPLMFLGFVFPGLMSISKQYWTGFLKRAFFAPAYLLMIYFSAQILANLSRFVGVDNDYSAAFVASSDLGATAAATFEGTIVYFMIICGFLIASLIVANKLGVHGASTAISLGKKGSAWARRKTITNARGAVFVGARAGLDAAAKDNGKRYSSKTKNFLRGGTRMAARSATLLGARDGLDSLAKPYDESSADWKKKVAGLNQRDKEARDEETIAEGQRGADELAVIRAAQKAKTSTSAQDARLPDLEKAEAAMLSVIAGMATSQLENMSASDIAKIAPNLTSSQIENVLKSDKVDPAIKSKLLKTRIDAITGKITATNAAGVKVLRIKELTALSTDEIETLGDEWIRKNAALLSNTQMEDLKKSKKFTEGQKNSYASIRSTTHKNLVDSGTTSEIAALFRNNDGVPSKGIKATDRKPKEVANLGKDVLTNDKSLPFLTGGILNEIAKNETLLQPDRAALRKKIEDTSYSGANKTELQEYFKSSHGQRHW